MVKLEYNLLYNRKYIHSAVKTGRNRVPTVLLCALLHIQCRAFYEISFYALDVVQPACPMHAPGLHFYGHIGVAAYAYHPLLYWYIGAVIC